MSEAVTSDADHRLGHDRRDEAEVVDRCLASVRPLIDTWTVVDTGSVDDTVARIEAAVGGLPGRLLEEPWVDFGHNRSSLMRHA